MINKNTLYFHLLTDSYFDNYCDYDEFQCDNNRGHGLMIIDINNRIIAIPLRSGLPAYMIRQRHLFPYTTYTKDNGKECLYALDFSKLMFIDEKYIDQIRNYIFRNDEEKRFYLENFNRIFSSVKSYINSYIRLCKKIEENENVTYSIMKPYIYSTLRNFHTELGINITKQQFIDIRDTL